MIRGYKTIAVTSVVNYEEKKSKFISTAKPVETEEEALEYINFVKSKYWDATHNVYAYSVRNDVVLQRSSDDGEPSGTAGIPTLETIKKLDLENIVVVTTRYFGGTLLGAGGLIRAYGKSAQLAIEEAGIIKKAFRLKVKIIIEYGFLGKVKNLINKLKYQIFNLKYDRDIEIIALIPEEELEFFIEKINNETNGRVLWEKLGSSLVTVEDE